MIKFSWPPTTLSTPQSHSTFMVSIKTIAVVNKFKITLWPRVAQYLEVEVISGGMSRSVLESRRILESTLMIIASIYLGRCHHRRIPSSHVWRRYTSKRSVLVSRRNLKSICLADDIFAMQATSLVKI